MRKVLQSLGQRCGLGVILVVMCVVWFARLVGGWLWRAVRATAADFAPSSKSLPSPSAIVLPVLCGVVLAFAIWNTAGCLVWLAPRAKPQATAKAKARAVKPPDNRRYPVERWENPLERDARLRFRSSLPGTVQAEVWEVSYPTPGMLLDVWWLGPRHFAQLIVTAYYAPEPNQTCWAQGSYAADIAMNGEGKFTASGEKLQFGYIAADRAVPFNTRMRIPGYNPEFADYATVMDRSKLPQEGGRIFGRHIDVFMGRGNEACKKAVAWGTQTLLVEILEE